MKRGFGSDNHAGIHPHILQSLSSANQGHVPSYGTDAWTLLAEEKFREHFGEKAQPFFVFNGTAANVSALKAAMNSYQAVFCADVSHLQNDECGAPEFFTGGKLISVPSTHGKITPEGLEDLWIRRGDQHASQAQVLSLTQPTELGTVYSVQEIKNLVDWAHGKKLFVHIDGARLANAAVHLDLPLKAFTTDLNVDLVSLGGTKNGLMMGEVVLFLNPSLSQNFKYIRKQMAQLPSKSRFIACQFLAYFENDLWKKMALHSCAMAQELYRSCQGIPGVEITQKPESNAVFAKIPRTWLKALREDYFFYVWNEKTMECRWMTSWDTESKDVQGFVKKLKELAAL